MWRQRWCWGRDSHRGRVANTLFFFLSLSHFLFSHFSRTTLVAHIETQTNNIRRSNKKKNHPKNQKHHTKNYKKPRNSLQLYIIYFNNNLYRYYLHFPRINYFIDTSPRTDVRPRYLDCFYSTPRYHAEIKTCLAYKFHF